MNSIYSFFFLLMLCVGCGTSDLPITISISETVGLNRDLEYITATMSLADQLDNNNMFMATDSAGGLTIPVEVLKMVQKEDRFDYEILFPVHISANETKKYQINILEKMRDALPVQLMLSEDKLSVENGYYKIHFSTEDDKRGGQINGIELKDFENQLLKRGHISMHWAPNFSKTDSKSYFNMEDFPATSENSIVREHYYIEKEREAITDSVPEIHVKGRYQFYADLPYFLFESTMTMEKEVELDLLRNDEMTMDSLFTHVVYPKKDGNIEHLKLYDELDVLEENPITDDADWVAFYNLDKGYGFGSIRVKYDNSNLKGQPSPTRKPYTKISRASGNGRYWNRVLSDTIQTFPKGSRYDEKNAYLIFSVDAQSPEKEILYYFECLRNPLKVEVGS